MGIPSVGIERHPMACFASKVKVDWSVDPEDFVRHAEKIAELATNKLLQEGLEKDALPLFQTQRVTGLTLLSLPPEISKLLLGNSISPLPLHRTLVLLDVLKEHGDSRFVDHERLALAKAIVHGVSNLHFGPEVGVGRPKHDVPVVEIWLENVRAMAQDVRGLQGNGVPGATVLQEDSRDLSNVLAPQSVDAVITSPPYPNEKDYTRTTRLESVLLGFVRNKEDLRSIKQALVRSNTRSVYKTDQDDLLVVDHDEIQEICNAIERRRLELGKTSGFERMYARVARLYFGGMARHLAGLRVALRPGAHLAYVVGDQASYLRVMIRTGRLLAGIAQSLNYEVLGVDLFRTRLATSTREQLREEVVVLRWSGDEPNDKAGRNLGLRESSTTSIPVA
jgi:hypothetical protein